VPFQSNTYVIQPDDPDPLPNQGNVRVQDLCNAGVVGCNTGVNTVQFTGVDRPGDGLHQREQAGQHAVRRTSTATSAPPQGATGSAAAIRRILTRRVRPTAIRARTTWRAIPRRGSARIRRFRQHAVPRQRPNLCTTAGCEQGVCVQTHLDTLARPIRTRARRIPRATRGTGCASIHRSRRARRARTATRTSARPPAARPGNACRRTSPRRARRTPTNARTIPRAIRRMASVSIRPSRTARRATTRTATRARAPAASRASASRITSTTVRRRSTTSSATKPSRRPSPRGP
jgi:hypothetical protein